MPDIAKLPTVNLLVEEIITKLPADVAKAAADDLRPLLTEKLAQTLMEGEFYRRLSEEMLNGIQGIFQTINQTKTADEGKKEGAADQAETEQLFNEASKQLDEIMTTTEQAASQIMEVIEKQQDLSAENVELISLAGQRKLDAGEIERLHELNNSLDEDLTTILTALSFQDLTGQRIKKIIATLGRIEHTAFDLFMSTGLAMKAHAENPDKDIKTIQTEAKQKASELKGPSLDTNQQDVDDLLAQLGL